MSKKPKIDHEYHAGKDKLKITISGYADSLRHEIVKRRLQHSPIDWPRE